MEREATLTLLLIICLLFSFTVFLTDGARTKGNHRSPVRLFVFGDSYADTGNCQKSGTGSWKPPYGSTFPGNPTGRFSDGRVLTDYIASFLGMESPVPYNQRKEAKKSQLAYGMNFAHGGTGVFNTRVNEPNMTTQVDMFQRLVEQNEFTKQDLNSSIALVSLAGNDYATYVFKNGDVKNLSTFTTSVIDQLSINLKRIQALGVRKIAITAIEPLGCLPQLTAYSSYKNCSESWNSITDLHNQKLQQTVQKLNHGESKKPVFVILDLHGAFVSVLQGKENHSGGLKSENLLKPCCEGVSREYSCGNVDKKGVKMYRVCEKPGSSFFWDIIHPSQSGWHAVFVALQSSLHDLYDY